MMKSFEGTFPGGSRSRVTKAGTAVRNGRANKDDFICIDQWRAAHANVLNTFQALLRNRAKNKTISVGQRHKRKNTIFAKLLRFPKMELARMDDIAGCRMIFENINDLYKFRKSLHSARFKHKRKNADEKYEYISNPNPVTGYRGIHDIYEYDPNSKLNLSCKGLLIEIQYRTKVQHAWATAVELIGAITKNQPKFQQGDKRYIEAMKYASEILARAHEGMNASFPELTNEEVINGFQKLNQELSLLETFKELNSSDNSLGNLKNAILILEDGKPLEIKSFRYGPNAIRALFAIERERPGADVVLVQGESSEDIRFAFKNYFSDAREFVALIKVGIEKLSLE